jgi:2-oxoglutarate dehydrogenase E2 component (dihydrolipoamide succinyltransferase)
MPIDIQVPSVGESITEGTLARWLKQEGDLVEEGDPLFELETDKATGTVPAPASGKLGRLLAREGDTVKVGAVVGSLEPAPEAEKTSAAHRTEKEPSRSRKTMREPAGQAGPTPPAESKAAPPQPAREPGPPPAKPPPARAEPSPAKEALPIPAPARAAPAPAVSGDSETRQPMSRIRRTIAARLVEAQRTAAILTTFNEADLSEVIALRQHFKEPFKERHGVGLGFMSFFIRASIEALKAYPVVNSRIDGDEIVTPNHIHIGVAVSTERGLMVPVIRHADLLSFADLEKAVADFAARARDGKIAPDDLRGGTFTITNGGVFGSLLSTPILNPPQSAILGMHTIQKRPVVVADEIVIRPMMYLALSYDHRLIDGREAVLFLVRIKECIERPERMMLGI